MQKTKKSVEARFNNLKNFCKELELENYSLIDGGKFITIGLLLLTQK